jgi:hypothetical protein
MTAYPADAHHENGGTMIALPIACRVAGKSLVPAGLNRLHRLRQAGR